MRKKAVNRGCLSFLHRWDGQCSTNLTPEGREMGEGALAHSTVKAAIGSTVKDPLGGSTIRTFRCSTDKDL